MKKLVILLLLFTLLFSLFGCKSNFFTEDTSKTLTSSVDIIGFAVLGIIQLGLALLMLAGSSVSVFPLTDLGDRSKHTVICLVTSVPILFFAGRFLSTAIDALSVSNELFSKEDHPGKNFFYLINEFVFNGNSWMQTEYIGGKWIWTFLAGIGLVILWIVLNVAICKSLNSILEQDAKENKEIERRNAQKEKKYSIETNYDYNHLTNRLSSRTTITDVTKYETPTSTLFFAFLVTSISLVFLPAFTVGFVILGYLVLIALNLRF